HTHACVSGDELANAVPVMAIESFDIQVAKSQRVRVGDRSHTVCVHGGCRQLLARAVERRLDATHSAADEVGNLLKGVIEHVLQQYTCAFFRWKDQHQMLDGAPDTWPEWVDWRRRFLRNGLDLRCLANASPAEKIDALVVRDSEQPRSHRPVVVEGVQLPICLEESVLNDILAVENRPRHPRTITVQGRTQMVDRFEEREVARVEDTRRRVRSVRHVCITRLTRPRIRALTDYRHRVRTFL